jgi:hypothetical protein
MRWWSTTVALGLAACSAASDGGASAEDAQRRADATAHDAVAREAAPPDAAREAAPPDAARDATTPDATADAAVADAAPPDAGPRPPLFAPRPPPVAASDLHAPRSWRLARGLIHMHSAHSHDACDGHPRIDGQINEPCIQQLRAALCTDRIDYMLLTDHPSLFGDVEYPETLLYRDGDTLEHDAQGHPIANYIACPDGRRVLVSAGTEGGLMPVMLPQHAPDRTVYDREDVGAVQALHAAGAIVLQAHTERFTPEELAPLGLDGFEIYNLHANIDPRGVLGQFAQVLPDLAALINAGAHGPHPDLSFLAIFRENPIALRDWDALIPHQRVVGTAGSDIHQNVPPIVHPADGERIDSYRRLAAWFANYLLVDEITPTGVRDALTAGRLFVTFDLLGAPDGFDFHGETAEGATLEMGAELPFAAGTHLKATPPPPPGGDPITLTLKRVTADGVEEVAHSDGAPIDYEAAGPGAYRLEVWITPEHLRADLGTFDRFVHPYPWIYANPIYLR